VSKLLKAGAFVAMMQARRLEHDDKKWTSVFVKNRAKIKIESVMPGQPKIITL
jgi:hypothetical protein